MLSGIGSPAVLADAIQARPRPTRMQALNPILTNGDQLTLLVPKPIPTDPTVPLDPPPTFWQKTRTFRVFALPTLVGAGLGLGIAAATGTSLGIGALIGAGVGLAAIVGTVIFALRRWN